MYEARIGGLAALAMCNCGCDGGYPAVSYAGFGATLPQLAVMALGTLIMSMTIWGQIGLQYNERKIKK